MSEHQEWQRQENISFGCLAIGLFLLLLLALGGIASSPTFYPDKETNHDKA